jgi:hypothetical protein
MLPSSRLFVFPFKSPASPWISDLASESILDREVSGLGLVIKVLDCSCAFANKYSGYPTGFITETPYPSGQDHVQGDEGLTNSHTWAKVVVKADLNDVRVVLGSG